jgi:hypothetical protein
MFWLDIQNWVRFVVKTFLSLLGASRKLVLLKSPLMECVIYGLNIKNGFIQLQKVFRRRQTPLKY